MDSLEIEGKEYISAKRAAREHSYTMDYIGQLIRGGKLIGKKVGRAWYVEQDSLSAYVASLLKAELPSNENQEEEQLKDQTNTEITNEKEDLQEVVEEQPESVLQEREPVSPMPSTEASHAQPTYRYPMLNYVRGDEKEEAFMPEIAVREEQPVILRREGISKIPTPQQQKELAENQVRKDPTKPVVRAVNANIAPYLPAKRPALLPALFGVAGVLLVLAAVGLATFFTKTINYEEATASVTQSFEYGSIFR